MKTRLMTISLLALATALTTACSGPDLRYASPAVTPSVKVSSLYSKLEVVEVTLPTYAASENIFAQAPDGAITELGPLWADDPARAMTLQLARDFAAITGATAAPDPWPFRSFPDAKVDVRLEEMLATAEGTFRISGQFFVAPEEGGRDRAGQFSISVPLPEEASISQIAAARSAATTQLAEQIARQGLR